MRSLLQKRRRSATSDHGSRDSAAGRDTTSFAFDTSAERDTSSLLPSISEWRKDLGVTSTTQRHINTSNWFQPPNVQITTHPSSPSTRSTAALTNTVRFNGYRPTTLSELPSSLRDTRSRLLPTSRDRRKGRPHADRTYTTAVWTLADDPLLAQPARATFDFVTDGHLITASGVEEDDSREARYRIGEIYLLAEWDEDGKKTDESAVTVYCRGGKALRAVETGDMRGFEWNEGNLEVEVNEGMDGRTDGEKALVGLATDHFLTLFGEETLCGELEEGLPGLMGRGRRGGKDYIQDLKDPRRKFLRGQ